MKGLEKRWFECVCTAVFEQEGTTGEVEEDFSLFMQKHRWHGAPNEAEEAALKLARQLRKTLVREAPGQFPYLDRQESLFVASDFTLARQLLNFVSTCRRSS